MEWLDVVDENGEPTGEVVERECAHREGIAHRTSHVWLYRIKDGKVQLLLQKRSEHKDSFPGCYDISSAGHIPAGDGYLESAIRELKEELGVDANMDSLFPAGKRSFSYEGDFYGKPFRDCQVTRVYVLNDEREEDQFKIQEEELSEVLWMDMEELIRAVRNCTLPNCIYEEELEMVEKTLYNILIKDSE